MPFLREPEDRPYDWADPVEQPIDPFQPVVRPVLSDFFGGVRDGLYWLFRLACDLFVPLMIGMGFLAFVLSVYSLGFTEGENVENILCVEIDGSDRYTCLEVTDETVDSIAERGLRRG